MSRLSLKRFCCVGESNFRFDWRSWVANVEIVTNGNVKVETLKNGESTINTLIPLNKNI